MTRLFRLAALAAIVSSVVATTSWGQSIATVTSNNAGGGVFIDLTANATPLIVTGLQTQLSQSAYPLATNIQVWTRSGTYVGNTTSTGWTLTQTIYATATSSGVNTETIHLPVQIQVPAGGTTGVYLHSTTSNGLRITGTSSIVPTTTFSNADVTLFTNTTRSGTTAFGGTTTVNRAFSGTIFYVPNTGTGACCTAAGVCMIDTPANCIAALSLYQGADSVCDPTPCPIGACCDSSGMCSITMRVGCVLPSQYSPGTACAALCPTGACCKPDGTCIAGLYPTACLALSGFHNGDNSTCPGVPCFPDFEPNNAKIEAPVITVIPGIVIRGHSTGSSVTVGSVLDGTADTYRLKMAAAPVGIYEYRATVSTPIANMVGTIVGVAQVSASAAPWTGTNGAAGAEANVQQAYNIAPSTDRISTWYGFGKQEELYYRVTSGVTAMANYNVAFERTQITPTDIGTLATGTIDIFTTGVVPVNIDTALAVFDSNLNPIPGYSNFNQSVNSYTGSANQNFTSYLRRTYAPGVYYLAMSIGDVTTKLGAPSDDNLRTTAMLDDFSNAALSISSSAATNVSFNIKDGTDHVITASRTNRMEIRWFTFTVNPAIPTGACCTTSGVCSQISNTDCVAILDAIYHGNDTTCVGAPCLTGACCLHDASCSAQYPAACDAADGLHLGEGVACPGLPCYIELEPNSSRLESNEFTLASGQTVRGRTQGVVSTPLTGTLDSADYFRMRTAAAAPGIYHHTLTVNSLTVGHSASIRGVEQAPTLPGGWPGPVGTATGTEVTVQSYLPVGDSRVLQWYGFGKEEQVTCRVTGAGTVTTSPYAATLTTVPVVPTNLGTFNEGNILVTTGNSGHVNDTAVRVYDANFNPIEGYANDGASTYGGSPGNSNSVSFLLRQYSTGTYYLGIAMTQLATNQGTPCDDNVRDGVMMEFPDVAVSADASSETNLSFIVYDGTFYQFAAARGGRGEMAWFTFTVAPPSPTGVCCRGTTCSTTVAQVDCTAISPVGAVFVATGSSVCNDIGNTTTPCCFADFNKNGSVQIQDIFDFLNAWFVGSLQAKFGGDGASGTLSVSDIFEFLNAWFVGC